MAQKLTLIDVRIDVDPHEYEPPEKRKRQYVLRFAVGDTWLNEGSVYSVKVAEGEDLGEVAQILARTAATLAAAAEHGIPGETKPVSEIEQEVQKR